MLDQKVIIQELCARAGITLNGPNHWDLQVKDERFYGRLLRDKTLGLGEAYMDGLWDCERLDEFIHRAMKAHLDEDIQGEVRFILPYMAALLFNPQSRSRAAQIADRHYDLGNELFLSFLDPYNQYSCAYFNGTDDLSEAQQNKLELICRKINLQPQDHLLDIGCGWGGLARYAAEHHGCRVTGISVSGEQVRFAEDYCKNLPVRIMALEYRDLEGTFDKIVSVGMFEHVGQKNYRTFMEIVGRSLKDEGIFLLQTIGSNVSDIHGDPWIHKYIFPNGMLPSLAQIGKAAEGLFVIEDCHNLGPHYDRTLMHWHHNFQKAWGNLSGQYDQRFKRMWEYYLLSCAGAFRARRIQLWQLVFTRSAAAQPLCRLT